MGAARSVQSTPSSAAWQALRRRVRGPACRCAAGGNDADLLRLCPML